MNKPLKLGLIAAGAVAGLAVLLVGGVVAYLSIRKPDIRPPSTERVEPTPERIARGKYLAEHVAGCIYCHSDHLPDRSGMPVKPGSGGEGSCFLELDSAGICPGNLTSDPTAGLGRWTDGELLRALREGVRQDGQVMVPTMPFSAFHEMGDEDARSVVAYLRTLPPSPRANTPRELPATFKLMIQHSSKPVEGPVAVPDLQKDPVAYGKYLATIGLCDTCHTQRGALGGRISGREFSGGVSIGSRGSQAVSTNLTPDPDSFVGRASKEQFIARFKAYAKANPEQMPVVKRNQNSIMDWYGYSGMTEQDLGAIYDYLRSLPPVKNPVNPFPLAQEVSRKSKPGQHGGGSPSKTAPTDGAVEKEQAPAVVPAAAPGDGGGHPG